MINRPLLIFLGFLPLFTWSQVVYDIDGNEYPAVTIGKQVWMGANLKTKHFSNGDTIFTTQNCNDTITDEVNPKYWWVYNCNDSLESVYGLLYTWYVAADNRNVCPTGWHVPSRTEFDLLEYYLGGSSLAGGKLKQTGTVTWKSPNIGATNEFNYNGVANGHRSLNGTYNGLHTVSDVWTTTEGTYGAWDFDLHNDDPETWSYDDNKEFGFAIRCLRDEPSDVEIPNDLSIITIYPNPVISDMLSINGYYNSNVDYQIISIDGKVFYEGTLDLGVNKINVQTLSAGIYLVRFKDGDQHLEIKFSKE